MTPPPDSHDDYGTRDEFAAKLERLVAEARDNDIPIEGAYNVRSPHPDDSDYTIEISEITKRKPASW